ncbi:GNAT family N-acetyltransferase [Burkholderia glumae]
MTTRYFLKKHVKIEPLVNRWHANPWLVYPPTAAYLTRHHLAIMASFVQHPSLHGKAADDPRMRGGPFAQGLDLADVPAMQALIDTTRADGAALLGLADDLDALAATLKEADGHSLNAFYARLPQRLRGLVELAYQRGNLAYPRLMEALFYDAYDTRALQSFALASQSDDSRPFCLSTPRLPSSGDVLLDLPFADPLAIALSAARRHGLDQDQFDALLARTAPGTEAGALAALFTRKPPPAPRSEPHEPRVRYFGHACVLVQTGAENLLFDPLVSYAFDGQSPRFTYDDLPEVIDYVVITHSHHDHFVLETLLQLRDRVKTIVVPQNTYGQLMDPSMKHVAQALGFANVMVMSEFDALPLRNGTLHAVPFLGEHGDLDIRSKLGFLVETPQRRVLMVADSNNLDDRLYQRIRARYGRIDTLFIGMECEGAPVSWLYGSMLDTRIARSMDESRRLNGSDCAAGFRLAEIIGAQRVFIYAMAQEPWLTFISSLEYDESSLAMREARKMVEACRQAGLEACLLNGCVDITLRAPAAGAGSLEADLAILIDGMKHKNGYLPRRIGAAMRVHETDGHLVVNSALPTDTFNLVISSPDAGTHPDTIAEIARGFGAAGLPAAWWASDRAADEALRDALGEAGFEPEETDVGMLAELAVLPEIGAPHGFRIRQIGEAADIARFGALIGALFVPPDPCVDAFYRQAAELGLAADEPLKLYLGELDGVPVCTVAIYLADDVAHVFDVSTAQQWRRRGLGTVALQAVLREARERFGARRAALQASPDGLGVYRRLGFREVCAFQVHSNRGTLTAPKGGAR